MPHAVPVCAIALILAGCASMNDGSARDTWHGATHEAVVAQWGAPADGTSLADGRQIYIWHTTGVVTRHSVWPSLGVSAASGIGVGFGFGVAAGAPRDVPVSCERAVIFQDGRVVNQRWRGPADFCSTFRRHP